MSGRTFLPFMHSHIRWPARGHLFLRKVGVQKSCWSAFQASEARDAIPFPHWKEERGRGGRRMNTYNNVLWCQKLCFWLTHVFLYSLSFSFSLSLPLSSISLSYFLTPLFPPSPSFSSIPLSLSHCVFSLLSYSLLVLYSFPLSYLYFCSVLFFSFSGILSHTLADKKSSDNDFLMATLSSKDKAKKKSEISKRIFFAFLSENRTFTFSPQL